MIRALVIALFALASPAFSPAKTIGLSISLISENKTISPGKPFTVGLHITHDPGFHTYWKNPGIVGIATSLTWNLPEGFTATEIRWPYPQRCLMAGHPCYGYERDVTLLVTITPPEEISAPTVDLQCQAHWMCCANTCHPGSKALSRTLPVVSKNQADPQARELITKAESELPIPSPAWTARLLTTPDEKAIALELTTTSSQSPKALFSEDGQISSQTPQKFERNGKNSWRINLHRSQFSPKAKKTLPIILSTEKTHVLLSPSQNQK